MAPIPGTSDSEVTIIKVRADVFECHAKPSTSRTLLMQNCKNKNLYQEDSNSSDDDDIYY